MVDVTFQETQSVTSGCNFLNTMCSDKYAAGCLLGTKYLASVQLINMPILFVFQNKIRVLVLFMEKIVKIEIHLQQKSNKSDCFI